ncbi:GPI ethanolamine phosphate transferase 2-like isoform X3 [Ruditapes philippinarum]|uniref:GPI ethanolamine phosphate transferase 2-like isoform X3 n=1 Tax=Ruditapes philippinarum TaxID=129788 RepID=UPI00295B59A5|nr:GPI ethanolamine phosphate transferase 2-like isoform X3 [Ruditapes philippinarum]
MMKISGRTFLLFVLLIQFYSFCLFLVGFFPLKRSLPGTGMLVNYTLNNHIISQPKQLYDKIVLVVIDALRSDFIYEYDQMPFVSVQLKTGNAEGYIVKANPPTVTLPRIKALTSGTIPGFVDVVLNFDSKALTEDNLISQAYNSGRKVVFYGDDTWVNLFPGHFTRTEGTTSFFVTDYTEVDNNVTRHIDHELSASDWDLMVLHYLGLDHIGHTVGPTSPLVKPKLQEMDDIVQKLYTTLEKKEENFLLLVCGDHGMSDQGSHGGASDREVLVPAVFLSPSFNRRDKVWKSQRELLQVDLAPTLSVLMGLPIPKNNLGQVLIAALEGLNNEEKLNTMYINMQQIVKLMEKRVSDFEKDSCYDLYLHAVNLHRSFLDTQTTSSPTDVSLILHSYESAMESISRKISGALITYDHYSMLLAILLLFLTLIVCILLTVSSRQPVSLTLSSSTVILITLLVSFSHVTFCTSQSLYSTYLCGRSYTSVAMQLVSFGSILFSLITLSSSNFIQTNIKLPQSSLSRLLWLGTLFHTLSFGSSSFVEEEHQTWYFLVMTFYLVAMTMEVKGYVTKVLQKEKIYADNRTFSNISVDLATGGFYEQNIVMNKNGEKKYHFKHFSNSRRNNFQTISDNFDQTLLCSDKAITTHSMISLHWRFLLPWKQIGGIFTVMLLGRCMRTINQTGNKWLNTPDLADWLMLPQNKALLSFLVFLSHLLILFAYCGQWDIEYVCFIAGIFSCYKYRITTGGVNIFMDLNSPISQVSKGIWEARLVFFVVLLMNLIAVIKWLHFSKEKVHILPEKCKEMSVKSVQTFQMSWTLLITLVLRTHNTLLVAMVIVQEALLWRFVVKKIKLPAKYLAILCWWMGQTVFFQQMVSKSCLNISHLRSTTRSPSANYGKILFTF